MWLLSFGLDWVVLNRTIGAMSIFSVLSGADRSSIAEAKPCLAMSRVILRAIFALYLGHPWWGPQADRKIWFWSNSVKLAWWYAQVLSSTWPAFILNAHGACVQTRWTAICNLKYALSHECRPSERWESVLTKNHSPHAIRLARASSGTNVNKTYILDF
jgi:hypothetical protein